jgi:integrase
MRALSPDSLVFANVDGTPVRPASLTQVWRRLMRRMGLGGARLHDLRHAHATLMLKAGVHPKVVQERLGHANISITLGTYSHVVPGLQEAAALRFEEGLLRTPKEESAAV